jgi:protein-disulfide isomerase
MATGSHLSTGRRSSAASVRRARWSSVTAALLFSLAASSSSLAGCGSSDGNAKPEPKASAQPSTSGSASAAAAELALATLDTSALTPREKRELSAQLSETLAPCPEVAVSLAVCISEKRSCASCGAAAEFLGRQVRAGKPKKDREEAFAARFDPKLVKEVTVGDAPVKGPADAVVTIVEWADFECPFCMMMAPLLESLVERFPGQVRVAYKFYPLKSHKNGELAARAAIAANGQGKFWPMHELLFANQGKLERRDIEGIAKKVELDMVKFKADITADATSSWLDKDMKQADELGLEGTPLIYINGRLVPLEQLAQPWEDLEAWAKLDIELAGQKPNPPSARFLELTGGAKAGAEAAGSAAPAAGSAAPAAGSAAPAAGSAAPAASAAPR